MNRIAATIAAVAVVVVVLPVFGAPVAHGDTLRPIELCVTTTWRAHHTHQPKTQPGQECIATPDMWIPRGYKLVGYYWGYFGQHAAHLANGLPAYIRL